MERYSRSDAAAWVSGVRVKVIVIVHFRSLKPTPPQTTNKTKLLAFFSSSLLSNYILPCRQETIFPCSSFIKIKIQKHRPFFGSLGLVKATLLTDFFTSWHIYTTGSVWVHRTTLMSYLDWQSQMKLMFLGSLLWQCMDNNYNVTYLLEFIYIYASSFYAQLCFYAVCQAGKKNLMVLCPS